jgi:hypothetical protein
MDVLAWNVWLSVHWWLLFSGIGWTTLMTTLIAAALPGGVAIWVALSERRRADALRARDRAELQTREERAAEDEFHRRATERHERFQRKYQEDARRDAESRRELRLEAVLQMNETVWEMLDAARSLASRPDSESAQWEVERQAEAFAMRALRMYLAEPGDEDLHTRVWVDQVMGRYRELTGTGAMTVPGIEWAMESTTVTELLAYVTRRLDLWARGAIGAGDLGASTESLARQLGLWRLDDAESWQSPFVHGQPAGHLPRTK